MELWDAYFPDGTKAGTTLVRGKPVPPEYRHGVTEILVVHTDGEILLMQRDFRKPNLPGFWEASAGGSVLKGEDFLDCAKRELLEETGISRGAWEELYRDVTDIAIYTGYLCVTNVPKDSIRLQEGETIAYRWVNLEALRAALADGSCLSNTRGQLDAVLARLEELRSLRLSALQPSQLYISERKLQRALQWFDPNNLGNFEPLPIKWLDGVYVLTDGHTRAYAAHLAGLTQVPLCLEPDELDWEAYRTCVTACRDRGISSVADLRGCVLSESDYQTQWLDWCKKLRNTSEDIL